MGHEFLVVENFFGHVICGHPDDGSNFVLQNLKSQGSLQMLEGIWEILSSNIRNIINDAGFETFFKLY